MACGRREGAIQVQQNKRGSNSITTQHKRGAVQGDKGDMRLGPPRWEMAAEKRA